MSPPGKILDKRAWVIRNISMFKENTQDNKYVGKNSIPFKILPTTGCVRQILGGDMISLKRAPFLWPRGTDLTPRLLIIFFQNQVKS